MTLPIDDWMTGVLQGLAAPDSGPNRDLLATWARFESPASDLMRWNNPLNTTWKMPGSRNSGAQPGNNDVQIYSSVAMGITATVQTMQNGRYPAIVQGLRFSEPASWFQANAAAEFSTWGTGPSFLNSVPGAGVPVPTTGGAIAPPSPPPGEAMAVIKNGNGSVGAFAHGPNGHIYHWWNQAGVWTGPEDVTGFLHPQRPILGEPAAAATGGQDDVMIVFRAAADNKLYSCWKQTGAWYGPLQLPAQ
jgi:hypothetical protein